MVDVVALANTHETEQLLIPQDSPRPNTSQRNSGKDEPDVKSLISSHIPNIPKIKLSIEFNERKVNMNIRKAYYLDYYLMCPNIHNEV